MDNTVINSHFWTSIKSLINYCNYQSTAINREYLIKGLENTLKNGYDIQPTTVKEKVKEIWNQGDVYNPTTGGYYYEPNYFEVTGTDDNRPKPKYCFARDISNLDESFCVFPACHCGLPNSDLTPAKENGGQIKEGKCDCFPENKQDDDKELTKMCMGLTNAFDEAPSKELDGKDGEKYILLKDFWRVVTEIIQIMKTPTQLNKSNEAGSWQLCPKCNGDGHLGRYNPPMFASTTVTPVCDVCNGSKIIAKPIFSKDKSNKDGEMALFPQHIYKLFSPNEQKI